MQPNTHFDCLETIQRTGSCLSPGPQRSYTEVTPVCSVPGLRWGLCAYRTWHSRRHLYLCFHTNRSPCVFLCFPLNIQILPRMDEYTSPTPLQSWVD